MIQDAISASLTVPLTVGNIDPRIAPLHHSMSSSSGSVPVQTSQGSIVPFPNTQFPQVTSSIKPLAHAGPLEPSLQSSPAREEGEVPESELDPDTRRRLLILQHGQDNRDQALSEPPFPVRPPMQVSAPRAQSRGNWFPVDEDMSPGELSRAVPKEFTLDSEAMHVDKMRPQPPPFFHKIESSMQADRFLHENLKLPKEVTIILVVVNYPDFSSYRRSN